MPQIHQNEDTFSDLPSRIRDGGAGNGGTGQEILKRYSIDSFVQVNIIRDTKTSRLLYNLVQEEPNEAESLILRNFVDFISKNSSKIRDLDRIDKEKEIWAMLKSYFSEYVPDFSESQFERTYHYAVRNFLGYGRIDPLFNDDNVEDISCDGVSVPIYVYHRRYQNLRTNLAFSDPRELNSFIVMLAQRGNKQISVSDPILNASTPEGNRVNATFGNEVTSRGGTFTIRLFRKVPFTPVDLIMLKTATPALMAYLWMATELGKNIIIIGGTGVGKTTTLNAISLFVPPSSKVVSIEDTREINIPHKNWIPSVTRGGVGEGRFTTGKSAGEIDMFDLLVASLRQRPDYLIVGEVRGREAFNLFQAMSMGQTTLTTMHSESIDNMVSRLENKPLNIPRTMLGAIDVVVLQSQVKLEDRLERRITEVSEMVRTDSESNEITFNKVFSWDPNGDRILKMSDSRVLTEAMDATGIGIDEARGDISRREDLLRYLAEKRVTDPSTLWNYFRKYLTNRGEGSPELSKTSSPDRGADNGPE